MRTCLGVGPVRRGFLGSNASRGAENLAHTSHSSYALVGLWLVLALFPISRGGKLFSFSLKKGCAHFDLEARICLGEWR